jgi:hypothetical protein
METGMNLDPPGNVVKEYIEGTNREEYLVRQTKP